MAEIEEQNLNQPINGALNKSIASDDEDERQPSKINACCSSFGIFKLQTSPTTFYTPPIAIGCSLVVQIILVIVFFGLLLNRNNINRINTSIVDLSKNGR